MATVASNKFRVKKVCTFLSHIFIWFLVLAFITFVAGSIYLVFVGMRPDPLDPAPELIARTQLFEISLDLQKFRSEKGRYPSSFRELGYSTLDYIDPWGSSIVYTVSSNYQDYDLYSKGLNHEDKDDDLRCLEKIC